MSSVTYLEAIHDALWEEMEADPRVFLLGQDVGTYGGAFRVTAGFLDRFGPERVDRHADQRVGDGRGGRSAPR